MKIKLLFLFYIGLTNALFAQDYTYLTDKKFSDPTELVGYNFVPNQLEIPNEGTEDLEPDEYSFGVSLNNLYVSGRDIGGVYNVNSINTTEYGFKLSLVNARDPLQQGHLKIILIGKNYVDALVFKKSSDTKELIFFLPQLSDEKAAMDKAYYTDRREIELLEVDSIWGTTIYPFFRVYDKGNVHERLMYSDSVTISFVEEIEIIEKIKKQKKEKGKKKDKGNFNIETGLYEGETAIEEVEEEQEILEEEVDETQKETEATTDTDVEKKIKIIKKYYIDVQTLLSTDGTENKQVKRYAIKKVTEREDESAEKGQERFQIELETNKGLMYLYLSHNRKISSFELFDQRYLMRGH